MQSDTAQQPSVAVAVPAYNEAEGIAGFLAEIDSALRPHTARLTLVVVDDASTDGTAEVLQATAASLGAEVEVIRSAHNQGHGATLLWAYRRALQTGPDFVLAVDGDGQFSGADVRRALVLLIDNAHAVCGVRRFRQDPWFRMAMTRLLRLYVRTGFQVGARDPNCPLRGYEAGLLGGLLNELPERCLIPNLYLTVLASRQGLPLLEVDVSHRVRRGETKQGTSWGGAARSPIPWRLVRFSAAALRESLRFRTTLRNREPAAGVQQLS